MYVCICNAITDNQISHAIDQGCGSVADVFRRVGEKPSCGKCVPDLCRMVRTARRRPMPPLADAAD